jgi:hypothetical protein
MLNGLRELGEELGAFPSFLSQPLLDFDLLGPVLVECTL